LPKFINLIGQKFNKLLVLKQAGRNKRNQIIWLCLCDCGNEIVVNTGDLKSNNTKSCGCLRKQRIIAINVQKSTHGHTNTHTYYSWRSMLKRCNSPSDPSYKNYGGRIPSIIVCDRWDIAKGGSFKNFLKDMGEKPKNKSLGRTDNDKGYYKENCRWETPKQQANNRRSNFNIPFKNKVWKLGILAKRYNINRVTLKDRLDRGMSIEEALTTPIDLNKRRYKNDPIRKYKRRSM